MMRDNLRRLLLPAALLLALGLLACGIGYATKDTGGSRASLESEDAPGQSGVRGVVQELSGQTLRLSTQSGPVQVQLAPDARVERLRSITIDAIRPGDWLNAGAIPSAQIFYAFSGLVVIPPDGLKP